MRQRSRNDDNSVGMIDNLFEVIDNLLKMIDKLLELIDKLNLGEYGGVDSN